MDSLLDDEEKEYDFKLYSCDEKDFFQLHELIIHRTGKTSLMSGHGVGLVVKLFTGDLAQVISENPVLLFKNVSVVGTRRLGFPDVIMPGVVRYTLQKKVVYE